MVVEKQEAAVIDKSDIEVLGGLKGMTNSEPVTISGTDYGCGQIVFRGFAGAMHIDDRRYHGAVLFQKSGPEDAAVADFAPILRAMDVSESEVADVLQCDSDGND